MAQSDARGIRIALGENHLKLPVLVLTKLDEISLTIGNRIVEEISNEATL
jgi:hypothetical protein